MAGCRVSENPIEPARRNLQVTLKSRPQGWVRESDFAEPESSARVTAKELELSAALVESFSSDFKPGQFHDEYQEELRKLVDAKLKQGDALDTTATFGEQADTGDAEVIDLMEALKQSVARSRANKSRAAKKGATTASGTNKKEATSKSKRPKRKAAG